MNTKIRHLNIEVTKRCNQRCFYCFNNSGLGSAASELTMERWLSILRALQLRGLESIHLTGGEPFAYKHAVELLDGAQAMGLSTSILSNGFRVEDLAGSFPEVFAKLAVAQISLDSMNEATHNLRRGYSRAWHDAVSAIRALRQLAVPVEVSCVVSETNAPDLLAVAEFCEENQAGLIVRPILAAGRAAAYQTHDSFAQDLQVCIQSLTGVVHLVTDRFYYVADDTRQSASDGPSDYVTVHCDGFLRYHRNGSEQSFNLLDFAA